MKVNITETVLRDAQQSLIATRMPFSDFEGILENLDNSGYYSLECWGGATFDSCLRYLDEDPWERLRKIKEVCKKTPLQMLIRGQNILGYKHYPDDVVRLFCRKAAENGMDIFRIFDALNDFRNIEVCIDEVKKCNKHAQGCICYTTSPVHTIEKYVEMGKQLESMGVDSIAIKDMAGICGPQEAYDLVKALKSEVKVPIQFHTHATTGLGPITLVKAVEAGEALKARAAAELIEAEDKAPLIASYVVRWFLLKKLVYVQYMVNKNIRSAIHDGDIHKQRNQARINADEIPFMSYRQMWTVGTEAEDQ